MAPLSYARLLFVADSLRASPLWYRGDFLPHYALVEVFHAAFAVWVVLVVTARVARDDMRARAFAPLSMSSSVDPSEEEDLEKQGVDMNVFANAVEELNAENAIVVQETVEKNEMKEEIN